MTVLAVPVLIADNLNSTDAGAQDSRVEAVDVSVPTSLPRSTTSLVTTTTTPPTQAELTATTAPATTTTTAPTTTTTRPVTTTTLPTPTTTAAPAPVAAEPQVNAEEGQASWYDYRPGECAHRSLPKGTVLHVTRIETGASVTCTITDRGPYLNGRVVDLDRASFAQLADPSVGLINVRITW